MYNFTIFKLRSTIEQMPALVVLKIKKNIITKVFKANAKLFAEN
jgi:hypothetical protein